MCAIFRLGKILGRVLDRKEKGVVAKDGEMCIWAGFSGCRSVGDCENGVQVDGGTFERALLAVQGLT